MKQKTIAVWYWITTLVFAAGMLFSGISELIGTEAGNAVLLALGYPLYLNIILGIAKILGVIALIVPGFKIIKEWAYAGFTFDFVGAALSFALNGDALSAVLSPLPFLIIMFISYALWKKRVFIR